MRNAVEEKFVLIFGSIAIPWLLVTLPAAKPLVSVFDTSRNGEYLLLSAAAIGTLLVANTLRLGRQEGDWPSAVYVLGLMGLTAFQISTFVGRVGESGDYEPWKTSAFGNEVEMSTLLLVAALIAAILSPSTLPQSGEDEQVPG